MNNIGRPKIEVTTTYRPQSQSYPNSDVYEYTTELQEINMDEERLNDLREGNGFIVTSAKTIKDDIRDPNGIFSPRYGMTLKDVTINPTRYKCSCGHMVSKLMEGQICPICKTPVVKKDDNFGYTGWLVLKEPYYIIHPNSYFMLSSFIGDEQFNNIIKVQSKKDEDGNDVELKKPKGEPYYGIGMMEFYKQFDDIMEYYKKKHKSASKQEQYAHLMKRRNNIFTRSISVFTTLLRPYKQEADEFHYEGTNAIYKIISKLVESVNKDNLRMTSKAKNKDELLYNLQVKVKELSQEIHKILAGKKGIIRQLYGGRFNFTSRSVIVPDPKLRLDEVKLSYPCLCGLLQQRIINVLQKTHNMHYTEAYIYLQEHADDNDKLITMIIEGFIKHDCNGRGIPIIINRNPTISYGGILQVFCTGIGSGYTMAIALTVLKGLAADQFIEVHYLFYR